MFSNPVGPEAPARVAAIISRFSAPAPTSESGPGRSADFQQTLAVETARQKAAFRISLPSSPTASLPAGVAYGLGSPQGVSPILEGVPIGDPGQAVIQAASRHLGVPYLWGGNSAKEGFDCSGLVKHAFAEVGVELPRWSRHQATQGTKVDSISEARPGDLLAFGKPVNHVALYVGDGRMLHAPKSGDVVRIGPIDRPIAAIRRIINPASTPNPDLVLDPTGNNQSWPWAPSGDAEANYIPTFVAAGQRWGVDPALLAAVAFAESRFNPKAQSPAGAEGLMQFMPATAAEMGVDPWDPTSAIDGAARYLRRSLDQFGSPELAVASYNAGRGAVGRYGGIPPYQETRNYVSTVTEAWRARS